MFVSLLAGALAATPASAGAAAPVVVVNGYTLSFDVAPYITANGRTMVPMRAIFEALGATVTWAPPGNVVAKRGAHEVKLAVGAHEVSIDGKPYWVDDMPALVGGRTFVPLRFVSTALGAKVDWDPAGLITITDTQKAQGPGDGGAGSELELIRGMAAAAKANDADLFSRFFIPSSREAYKTLLEKADPGQPQALSAYLEGASKLSDGSWLYLNLSGQGTQVHVWTDGASHWLATDLRVKW